MAKCSDCAYLNLDGSIKDGKYWCEYMQDWKYADDEGCYKHCPADNRRDSDIESAEKISSESRKTSTCFITTALCKILSMPDDNDYLNILRFFRNNYLQKNEDGLKLLIEYDVVGPQISERLLNDNSKFCLAYTLFNKYIVNSVEAIYDGDYQKAINIYTAMTTNLMNYYGIDYEQTIDTNEVDASLSGHGVLRKKRITI